MVSPVQLSLLEAGCQPWNFQVVAAFGNRFAYCATLSVYIFQRNEKTGLYALHSIITEHKRGITSICWHPSDRDVIATTSCDRSIIIWNIEKQCIVHKLSNLADTPIASSFCTDKVAFATKSLIYFWSYQVAESKAVTPKEYNVTFTSPVTAIQFCESHIGKVIIGHSDGTVSLLTPGRKPHRRVSISSTDEDDDGDNPEAFILDIQWDPHSSDYALVVSYRRDLVMLDTGSMCVLVRYNLPSKAAHLQTIAWVPEASGVFVTGDQQSGVLRIWSVSNSEPIRNHKIKTTGFHAMTAIKKLPHTGANLQTEPSATCHRKSLSTLTYPPTYLVCTFGDGGVGLYDLEQEKWHYLREKGHIETVFDCKFSPMSCHRLATASFDGSVKIWDTSKPQLTCECSSPGNEGILYQISWAPHDLNCLVVASAKYGAFVWDVVAGGITKRFLEHGKGLCVYTVCWNQISTSKILSGGDDHLAIVRDVDGSNVMKFEHPAAVYGCEWSPSNQSLFATGCGDGKVRIFHLPSTGLDSHTVHQPVKILTGHSSKSFHIKWSPLRDGYLASGSDDTFVRVWSYADDSCVQVLAGHTSNVRGLCWSPEIAYLLYSGSWDHNIILWDVRTGTRLATLRDHSGDVYGLSIHKGRPFTLASCSRDSTVRLWSTYQVAAMLPVSILARKSWNDIFSTPKVAMAVNAPPLLSGVLSSKIHHQTKAASDLTAVTYKLHQLFQYGLGVDNFLDLVKVVQGKPQISLSPGYRKGIVHTKHLTEYMQSEAMELDMARLAHTGGQIGAPSKQERIQKTADCYLRLGNLQKYCQLMIENNQWERALAIAPAVSMKFWRTLLDRYTTHLHTYQPSQLLPYQTAQRNPDKLVHYHLQNGAYHEALLAAVVGTEARASTSYTDNSTNDIDSTEGQRLLLYTVDKVAEYYIDTGHSILAACAYLSADLMLEAVTTLIRSNILELAYSLCHSLQHSTDLLHVIAERLAFRCERFRTITLAIDLLKSVEGSGDALVKLCIRNSGWECDRLRELISYHDSTYTSISLLPAVDEAALLLSLSKNQSDVDKIRLHLLSNNQSEGLKLAIVMLCKHMDRPDFTLTEEIITLLEYTQSIPSERLHKNPVQLFDLLTISCYLGALQAIRKGYDVIVTYLLQLTIKRLKFDSSSLVPLSAEDVNVEMDVWTSRSSGSDQQLDALYRKAGLTEEALRHPLYGEVHTAGCTLPDTSTVLLSLITGQRVKGAAYMLEDSTSALSMSEAIMWANVNPFTPISCAQTVAVANRINPY